MNLKKVRRVGSLSQEELARASRVSRFRISRAESGFAVLTEREERAIVKAAVRLVRNRARAVEAATASPAYRVGEFSGGSTH